MNRQLENYSYPPPHISAPGGYNNAIGPGSDFTGAKSMFLLSHLLAANT